MEKRVVKRGQVTIFIIIALVIIGAVILFFAFTDVGRDVVDNVISITGGGEFNVKEDIENCVLNDEEINSKIAVILKNGGEKEPEFFYLHKDIPHKYLCYSANYYEACVNQQPLLLQFVEKEIEKSIEPSIIDCVQKSEDKLKDRGYELSSSKSDVSTDIVQGNINIKINHPLIIRKGDSVQRFDSGFEIKKPSQAYQLLSLSTSIIEFEIRYGDSDPVAYMSIYPRTKVEKLKMADGTTLYKVSDRETMEEFNFATRSYALPAGYGL